MYLQGPFLKVLGVSYKDTQTQFIDRENSYVKKFSNSNVVPIRIKTKNGVDVLRNISSLFIFSCLVV